MLVRSKPRVFVTHRVFDQTKALLETVAEVDCHDGVTALPPSEVRARSHHASALMAFMTDRIDAEFLDYCPNLKVVAGALKGYDNLDAQVCAERGVWLSVVPDLLSAPTAELAVGLAIGLARNIRAGDQYMRSGAFSGWQPRFYGTGLDGADVGLVGMGAVGRAIAVRLGGFGCRLRYADPARLPRAEEQRLAARRMDRDALLTDCDFIVLALPLSQRTIHLIDATALTGLRPGAFLINPCRGSVVDEAAVLAALESGRLGGYAADAFAMEDWARPDRPPRVHPGLLAHPATLFTPHIGSAVVSVRQAIERRAAQNIIDALAGRRPRDAVNRPRIKSATC